MSETSKGGKVNLKNWLSGLIRSSISYRTLMHKTLDKGEVNKIHIRKKDVNAFQATSGGSIIASKVQNNVVYPSDVTIFQSVYTENMDVEQDEYLEEDARFQLAEKTVKKLDAAWYEVAKTNRLFTGSNFIELSANMIAELKQKGLSPNKWVFGSEVFKSLLTVADLDPVTKRELQETGKLKKWLGSEIITDVEWPEAIRIIKPNELFLCPDPVTLGVMSIRKVDAVEGQDPSGSAKKVYSAEIIYSQFILANMAMGRI